MTVIRRKNQQQKIRQIRMVLITGVFLPWLLVGCASLGVYNPATGQREFIFISTDSEVAMGKNLHNEIIQQYPLSQDDDKINRLQKIGRRLAGLSDRQDYTYHFYLIDKNDVNVFTVPGGNIYFFTRLRRKPRL